MWVCGRVCLCVCMCACREIEETFLPWLEEGVYSSILMAHDNERAVDIVVASTVGLQQTRKNEAAAQYAAILAAIQQVEDDRIREEARLLEEAEAAAAVAADEAAQAAAPAEADAAAAEGEAGAEGAVEGEGDAA